MFSMLNLLIFVFLLLGDYYDEYHGWMSLFIDVKQVFSSYNIPKIEELVLKW